MNSYKKISRDLLEYSFFSGLFLGLVFYLVMFFCTIELRIHEVEHDQTIDHIEKQLSLFGAFVFYSIFFIFPVFSTLFYRRKVAFLDYRSAFSVSCLTLLIGLLLNEMLLDVSDMKTFSLNSYIFSLPFPMAYSFLLAALLKKQN